jgi:hypothetical protein
VGSPKGLRKALALSDKLYWHAAFASLARLGLPASHMRPLAFQNDAPDTRFATATRV